jgi:hypothetical protein
VLGKIFCKSGEFLLAKNKLVLGSVQKCYEKCYDKLIKYVQVEAKRSAIWIRRE